MQSDIFKAWAGEGVREGGERRLGEERERGNGEKDVKQDEGGGLKGEECARQGVVQGERR